MQNGTLASAVAKLAIAGEQAGITVEQMIHMLDAGVSVGTLLELIEMRLRSITLVPERSSGWLM